MRSPLAALALLATVVASPTDAAGAPPPRRPGAQAPAHPSAAVPLVPGFLKVAPRTATELPEVTYAAAQVQLAQPRYRILVGVLDNEKVGLLLFVNLGGRPTCVVTYHADPGTAASFAYQFRTSLTGGKLTALTVKELVSAPVLDEGTWFVAYLTDFRASF